MGFIHKMNTYQALNEIPQHTCISLNPKVQNTLDLDREVTYPQELWISTANHLEQVTDINNNILN